MMDTQVNTTTPRGPSSQAALTKAELTGDTSIQLFVHQIAELVAVPTPHFQTLYLSAIANYLSMTQHCPRETVYARLQTVANGLKLRRSLVLPFDASPELASEQHDCWTYAVFVSLLMYNLSQEILGYEVVMQKNSGDRFSRWQPLVDRLVPPYRFKVIGTLPTSTYASLLLMPLIISDPGLRWLSEIDPICSTALELIVSPDPSNRLGALVCQAHHLNVDEVVAAPTSPAHSKPAPPAKVANTTIQKSTNKNIGVQFRRWLMAGISGVRDDANVDTTANGVVSMDHESYLFVLI